MTHAQAHEELDTAVDTIERGYEFLLAYAAQGRRTDRDMAGSEGPRHRLEAMAAAMEALPALARARAASAVSAEPSRFAAFLDALDRDAAVSAAAVRLVLSRKEIGSQIVDNLNASIHLRALLTDIFLVDEALKP